MPRPFTQLRLHAVALAALLIFALPSAASAETSQSADSFVDSIGVDTHTSFSDTPYVSSFATVKQRLAELGIRHIREDLVPDRPDQYQRLNELGALGIRSTLILGDPDDGTAGLEELLGVAGSSLQGSVEALEGPNEFDLRGGPDWMQRVADYQAQLYAAAKSSPALSALPILGPSIGWWGSRGSLVDLSNSLDAGTIHPYPNGRPPEINIDAQLGMVATMSAGKPVIATETGYHTALATGDDHKPVSEAAMATYLPRLFLDYYRSGVSRTFTYELLDEFPDAANARSESNFGLLRHDLSPKPAFVALKNLIAILGDPGPAFEPGKLDFRVKSGGRDLHQLLLQKRDGTFFLALWRASAVWDPEARTTIDPGSSPVVLDLARSVRSAREYLPNSSSEPLRALPAGRSRLSVAVGAQAVILALTPGPKQRGRIKLWSDRQKASPRGRLALAARLPDTASGAPVKVFIQRWKRGWRTIAHGRASAHGTFRKTIHIAGSQRVPSSRIRLVSKQAMPSNAIRVRLH